MRWIGWLKKVLPLGGRNTSPVGELSSVKRRIPSPLKGITQRHHVRHGMLLDSYEAWGDKLRNRFYLFRSKVNDLNSDEKDLLAEVKKANVSRAYVKRHAFRSPRAYQQIKHKEDKLELRSKEISKRGVMLLNELKRYKIAVDSFSRRWANPEGGANNLRDLNKSLQSELNYIRLIEKFISRVIEGDSFKRHADEIKDDLNELTTTQVVPKVAA